MLINGCSSAHRFGGLTDRGVRVAQSGSFTILEERRNLKNLDNLHHLLSGIVILILSKKAEKINILSRQFWGTRKETEEVQTGYITEKSGKEATK